MANTINDLYSKYTTRVEKSLEKDRYFQYLFEMVQAGHNTLQQKNRVLHKVVDERWLTVVEEGLTAIFNIVDKPRRFITTSEEVVPVALAKKITADSVRHLSQNTQFINTNAAGEIYPTKILNVTTEESYDLYENRFVYHLIQRLFAFVDKRTDVIFWSTGDETCDVMSMESKIDDAYEEISYKVEMTIKNRQSYADNDADNMELFKRIDRVRRMSLTLRNSSFCDIMKGCAKVFSPIQRTNLMMKDPDYRSCYKLWQFMESYDEVGYTIEEQDTALEFDEEYLLQMYINLITNYTVFKSLLESDPRKMTEIATKKRKPRKPKFIKKIEEEIVDNCDIPDVEIRKVFVEEVTQAQLDAEAKLKEETARREELEQSMSELEWEMDGLSQQLEMADQMQQDAEREKEDLQKLLEESREEKQRIEDVMEAADAEHRLAVETAQDEARAAAEAAQKDAQEKIAAAQAQAAAEIEKNRAEAQGLVKAAQEKIKAEAEEANARAEQQITALQKDAEGLREKLSQVQSAAAQAREKATADILTQQQKAEEAKAELESVKQQKQMELEAQQKRDQETIDELKRQNQEIIDELKRRSQEDLEAEQQRNQKAAEELKRQSREELKAAEQRSRETVEELKQQCQSELDQMQREKEELLKQLEELNAAKEKAEAEKAKALAKAEGNRLSRYIINSLQERHERKHSEDENKK